jgi:3-oxoadipate enol-lactonase
MPTNGKNGTLRTTDGVSISYLARMADQGRPAIALVHSLAMDHRFWDPVAERIGDRACVVAIDARGHGQSGKPEGPYTVERMAKDVHEVVGQLGLARVAIAGASMGGCVALQFAAMYPQTVTAAGLLDTTAWYGPTAPADWEGRAAKAAKEGLAALVDFQKTRWFSDEFRRQQPQVVERCIEVFLANDPRAYAESCRMLGAFDARALMKDVRVPTCVLVGEEDYAAPPDMARALHEGIAGSTLTIVPKARHLTPLEVPELVAGKLLSVMGIQ